MVPKNKLLWRFPFIQCTKFFCWTCPHRIPKTSCTCTWVFTQHISSISILSKCECLLSKTNECKEEVWTNCVTILYSLKAINMEISSYFVNPPNFFEHILFCAFLNIQGKKESYHGIPKIKVGVCISAFILFWIPEKSPLPPISTVWVL